MSDKIYSPANIRLLLDCFLTIDGFEPNDSPHNKDMVKLWLSEGIIERHEPFDATPLTAPHYRATPLGKAWIQALCNVAAPRQAFIDAQGNILGP